ncbi:MAG: helix-turn-helix transcriptional regulator [Saprospiraceae bacterium]|nr:helix-turn-helix transcriptional regulator [Saprospiraceae bacterium]
MTEKQILKSSLKLFNERGYHDVGMREIARELNLSPGNVTYYFKRRMIFSLHYFKNIPIKTLRFMKNTTLNLHLLPAF